LNGVPEGFVLSCVHNKDVDHTQVSIFSFFFFSFALILNKVYVFFVSANQNSMVDDDFYILMR